MLKRLAILFFIVFCTLPLASREREDSIVFRFVPQKDMFYVPYRGNGAELQRLFAIVKQYRKEIKEGHILLYVNGYCSSLSTAKKNLAVAKIRSNRVKSELITRAGLKESHFVTRNRATDGDKVIVIMRIFNTPPTEKPLMRADSIAAVVAETKAVPIAMKTVSTPGAKLLPVPVHSPGKLHSETSFRSLTKDSLPSLAFKTNLLYLSVLLLNAEAEYYLKGRWSFNLDFQYAWWSKRSKHKYYRVAAVSPEIRYWFASREPFHGHFGGFYLGTGLYEFMFKPTHGIQGEFFIAGGLTYGYALSLSKHLRMELSLGVGYMMTEYRQYHWDRGCYVYEKTQRYSYFGPTKAKVSIVWPLNLFGRKPRIKT